MINACTVCLKAWVDIQITDREFKTSGLDTDEVVFGIRCPECEGIMRSVNVQAATSKKMHDSFERQEEKWRIEGSRLASLSLFHMFRGPATSPVRRKYMHLSRMRSACLCCM
jgi:hypothetical protein